MYSKLIHTVDHVEGYLREGFDALDAFLCHTWAVTVTGAPKAWAARFIEKHERSARAWYGGAVGHVAFDGSLNTGLTLRTIHYADGVASVRAGATLLYDSDPIAEEAETELKASARLRRPVAFLRSYAIEATRLHLTMKWVVSFLILSTFRARSRLDTYHTQAPRRWIL